MSVTSPLTTMNLSSESSSSPGWPSLAEVTNLNSSGEGPRIEKDYSIFSPSSVSTTDTGTSASTTMMLDAGFDEEYGWNEDNIRIDFMTVNDLRKLLEKSGRKFDSKIYHESVTMVASMVEDAVIAVTEPPTSIMTTSTTTSVAVPSPTFRSTTDLISTSLKESVSSSSPMVRDTTSISPSAPTPLTLSLGSWQIAEEDIPLYIGSAAGIILLILVLLGATTWRCFYSQGRRKKRRDDRDLEKHIDSPSLLSSNSNNNLTSGNDSNRFVVNVKPVQQHKLNTVSSSTLTTTKSTANTSAEMSSKAEPSIIKPKQGQQELLPNQLLAEILRNDHKKKSHDSMVCLSGTRVESRIIENSSKVDPSISSETKLLNSGEEGTPRQPRQRDYNGSKIVTDVDDVIGSSPPDGIDCNTYVKLAPVVDNFLANQSTFHTFHPASRRPRRQSSDGMSSNKTSPNDMDPEESLTAEELAELREEARDRFASLPVPRRLPDHSDLFNGNLSSTSLSEEEVGFPRGVQVPMLLRSNNNNNHPSIQNSNGMEDLYAKVGLIPRQNYD